MIEHILNVSGYNVKALGNVGQPLTEVVNYENLDFVIAEVSSFQLEATYKFKPYIGVLLNIDDDHLDRHKSFENYLRLKVGLFKNCNSKDFAVLGGQNEIINNFKNVVFTKYVLGQDCFVLNDDIVYEDEVVCKLSELNDVTYIDNVLAVISVLKIIGLDNAKIVAGINTFVGLSHRLEFVEEIDGVVYYNDSKSTNPHATINAVKKLNNYENITLLLGGQDKGFDFAKLISDLPSNVKRIVAFGKAKKKIAKVCREKIECYVYQKMADAVYQAKLVTEDGVVLLSPACASFDEFDSYAHRGECFKKQVLSFGESTMSKGEVC